MKKIDIRNADREIIFQYADAQANAKKWKDAEADLKPTAIAIMQNAGHAIDSGKAIHSEKLVATVQQDGKAVEVTYVETTRSGSIDWQAYAIALGGNAADAEAYRKPATIVPAIRCKHLVNK